MLEVKPLTDFMVRVVFPGGESVYDLMQALKLDLTANELDAAMRTQPEMFCYCGLLKIQAQKKYNEYKSELSVIEANLYKRAKNDLTITGSKITEAFIDSYIKTEFIIAYREAYNKLYELEKELKLLEVGVEAFRMRANMLQSISALRRTERDMYDSREYSGNLEKYVEKRIP